MLRSGSPPLKSFEVTLSHHSFFYDKKLLAVIKKAQQGALNSISDDLSPELTWPSALKGKLLGLLKNGDLFALPTFISEFPKVWPIHLYFGRLSI